jgi:ubiquinone/menaquinone biosynthesis C-methylase UbiE
MVPTFRAGERVLEIGCGTGIDACFLADRGVRILACDCSSAMVHVARQRVNDRQCCVDLRVLPAEDLDVLGSEPAFDGAVSNFGALNCVEQLSSVARSLGRLVRPQGKLLICLLGPFCLWEVAWYLSRLQPRKAFRRLRRAGVTAEFSTKSSVHVTYYTTRQLADLFAPEFRLRSWRGVGLFVPPSYAEPVVGRLPRLLRLLEWADSLMSGWPGFRGLSDHILLQFERVAE